MSLFDGAELEKLGLQQKEEKNTKQESEKTLQGKMLTKEDKAYLEPLKESALSVAPSVNKEIYDVIALDDFDSNIVQKIRDIAKKENLDLKRELQNVFLVMFQDNITSPEKLTKIINKMNELGFEIKDCISNDNLEQVLTKQVDNLAKNCNTLLSEFSNYILFLKKHDLLIYISDCKPTISNYLFNEPLDKLYFSEDRYRYQISFEGCFMPYEKTCAYMLEDLVKNGIDLNDIITITNEAKDSIRKYINVTCFNIDNYYDIGQYESFLNVLSKNLRGDTLESLKDAITDIIGRGIFSIDLLSDEIVDYETQKRTQGLLKSLINSLSIDPKEIIYDTEEFFKLGLTQKQSFLKLAEDIHINLDKISFDKLIDNIIEEISPNEIDCEVIKYFNDFFLRHCVKGFDEKFLNFLEHNYSSILGARYAYNFMHYTESCDEVEKLNSELSEIIDINKFLKRMDKTLFQESLLSMYEKSLMYRQEYSYAKYAARDLLKNMDFDILGKEAKEQVLKSFHSLHFNPGITEYVLYLSKKHGKENINLDSNEKNELQIRVNEFISGIDAEKYYDGLREKTLAYQKLITTVWPEYNLEELVLDKINQNNQELFLNDFPQYLKNILKSRMPYDEKKKQVLELTDAAVKLLPSDRVCHILLLRLGQNLSTGYTGNASILISIMNKYDMSYFETHKKELISYLKYGYTKADSRSQDFLDKFVKRNFSQSEMDEIKSSKK